MGLKLDTRRLNSDQGVAGSRQSIFPENSLLRLAIHEICKSNPSFKIRRLYAKYASRQASQLLVSVDLHADLPSSRLRTVCRMFSISLEIDFFRSLSIVTHFSTVFTATAAMRSRRKPTSPEDTCSVNIGSGSRNNGDVVCILGPICDIKT